MICKTCGSPLRAGAGFCSNCGAAVPLVVAEPEKELGIETQRCPKCGAENPAAAKFCRVDGYQFAGGAAEASPDVGSPWPRSTTSPSQADVPEIVDTGEVRCPRCGAVNPRGSRFCRSDGAPLTPSERGEPESAMRSPRNSRQVVIGVGFITLLLAGAGMGYGYWVGLIGDRPGSVARKITESLHRKGYDQVTVTLGSNWVATVAGSVVGLEQAQDVEATVRERSELEGLNLERLEVKPSTKEIHSAVINRLEESGLGYISVEVLEDGNVVLSGRLRRTEDKVRAAEALEAVPGRADIIFKMGIPYSMLENQVNQALRGAGYFGVSARIESSEDIVLSGTIENEQDRPAIVSSVIQSSTEIGEAISPTAINDKMTLALPIVAATPTTSVAAASATSGLPFSAGQVWSGSYTCSQQQMALSLRVIEVSDRVGMVADGPAYAVSAVFEFHRNSREVFGAFELAGRYYPATREAVFKPGKWIIQPKGWRTVGLTGRVANDGQTFFGSVTRGTCGEFRVSRD